MHGGVVGSKKDATKSVGRNDVARHNVCTADTLKAPKICTHPTRCERLGAGGVGANEVALNNVIFDAVTDYNTVTTAAASFAPRDYVARWRAGGGRVASRLTNLTH